MERKPHLADLVRFIEVEGYVMWGTSTSYHYVYHTFDSLPFLPKIKRIVFPDNVKLDQDFLSVINSHPSLLAVHWPRTISFSFPNHLSLPHGALSRVLIDCDDIYGNSDKLELLWLYFTKLGLRVKSLDIMDMAPPPFLSLTYPDLRAIFIGMSHTFSSDSSEPLGWFPSFLERHPQLEVFEIRLDRCEGWLAWESLKNVSITRPLYDASRSRGLISSFFFESIVTGVEKVTSAVIAIDSPQNLPEVIDLVGSMLPIPIITLRFYVWAPRVPPINVNDFVSAFWKSHKTLSLLKLYTGCQALDLDSLSTDEELQFKDMRIEEALLSNSRLRLRTKQLAQLTRLLCAGLPRLKGVEFYEDIHNMDREDDDEVPFDWKFSVSGDGQVELVGLDGRYM